MRENTTQFSIAISTKDRLDKLKTSRKDEILAKYKKKKRYVTNTMVIDYLLDTSSLTKKN